MGVAFCFIYLFIAGFESPRLFVVYLEKTTPKYDSRLSGYWYSVFLRKSKTDGIKRFVHVIKIVRVRNVAIGVVERGHFQKFSLSGVLAKDEYLTGTWSNPDPSVAFKGTFQLRVHDDGETISGKWLGWNKHHSISSGLWAMTRMSETEMEASHVVDQSGESSGEQFELFGCNRRIESIVQQERNKDRQLGWREL